MRQRCPISDVFEARDNQDSSYKGVILALFGKITLRSLSTHSELYPARRMVFEVTWQKPVAQRYLEQAVEVVLKSILG